MAKNLLDLAEEIDENYVKKRCNRFGLGKYCESLLEKPLSKYEQCSNWGARPLRKAQLHYAAMDSYIMIVLYDILVVIVSIPSVMTILEMLDR